MEPRLGWITRAPRTWVHWEPWRGGMETHAALLRRYPAATVHIVESSAQAQAQVQQRLRGRWWQPQAWRTPPHRWTPPPEGGVDLLWSNMGLHAHPEPQALLQHWSRLLSPDGFLMFSCFGPDTLRELRALHEAEGWPPPAQAYTDMHDWGDMLVHSGFAEPVMDMERITLAFPTAERLLEELRGLGRNLHGDRHPTLRGRGWRTQWLRAVTEALANPAEGGQLTLTFEIVYGHAFKGEPRTPRSAESVIPVTDLRRQLSQRKP